MVILLFDGGVTNNERVMIQMLVVVDDPDFVVDDPDFVVDDPDFVVDDPDFVVDNPDSPCSQTSNYQITLELSILLLRIMQSFA